MGTVTYREPAVVETVNSLFVPVQLNVKEDSSRPIVERYRHVWTPDIRVLGADGFDYCHWNGYLPPFEFVPRLLVGQAQARLRSRDFAGAADVYEDVLRRFPTSEAAPEAQYFLAAAKYEASQNPTELHAGWHRLQTRYPDSPWRVRQSFSE